MPNSRPLLMALCLGGLLTSNLCSFAAPPDEDDEEFRPGLVAEYRVGERAVTRIDPDVAFAWDEATPDSRLSAERFEATWRGLVLIRLEAKHRLHAFVQGEVTVELDGRRVLHGSAKQPQWISGDEFVPGFAERPLVVTFRKTEPAAQLKLFWSSDAFSLEPLPPELLFHEQTPAEVALIERGRQQFAAFRCGRCHVREGDAIAPAAPALQHVAAGMTVEQIAQRLNESEVKEKQASGAASAPRSRDKATGELTPPRSPMKSDFADRRMPHFRLNEEQARHLAAFLVQQSEPVKLDEPKPLKTKPPKEGEPVVTPQRRGEVLLRSVGCLACHRVGELGNSNDLPFAGPDLTSIGQRRSQSWLLTWLSDPQRLNVDHRMPVFTLTDEERQLIVAALTNRDSSGEPAGVSPRTGNEHNVRGLTPAGSPKLSEETSVGRQLFEQHRCAACHRTKDAKLAEFARAKSNLSQPITDWSKGCMAEGQGLRGEGNEAAVASQPSALSPVFSNALDRDALKAFVASRWSRPLSRESQFVRGTRMLEEKNCSACHPRHGGIGLGRTAKLVATTDKELNGQAPSLVAPSLNAVGDKLLDEALSIAVRGERQPIRMPWLKVRMPKFKHSPDELATLTRYFVEHDRIPFVARGGEGETRRVGEKQKTSTDPAVLSPAPLLAFSLSDPHTHLAGQALMGVKGWSCIACHKIGDYEPKQVALGARGSDLKMLGKHLRPEFFFRWIASPLRVLPGVEMPQFNRPVAGVLDGNLSKQHAALWQALNDPNFQPPTNPANVEQLWVVNPGERARIIRDVFQLPKELGGGTVPRSFAVGFDNGHSFLFDLDTASLRQWTFGDFARQQAIGKRWLWEMAGLPLRSFAAETEVRLWTAGSAPSKEILLGPIRVMEYGTQDGQKELVVNYQRWFDPEHRFLEIGETLEGIRSASDASQPAGIKRETLIWRHQLGGDDELELRVRIPKPLSASPVAKVELTDVSLQDNYISDTSTWTTIRPSDVERDGWLRIRLQPHAAVRLRTIYSAILRRPATSVVVKPVVKAERLRVASVPGFDGWQLPIDTSIMPTGLTWSRRGPLAFTSLKGHVFVARDVDGDGLEDDLRMIQEGLAAPYGITAYHNNSDDESEADGFLVAHKPDILHLVEESTGPTSGFHFRQTLAEGWGYNDDYHDWTCGFVRDSQGRFLFGLGSDYTDKNRPAEKSRWRGKVLRLDADSWMTRKDWPNDLWLRPVSVASLKVLGHAFRYPTGLAINERDEVFVSDQQGVQNCFNEINYLVEGAHYGVPSTHEEDKDAPETKAAIQIPHPWTRSVNGLVFLTGKEGYPDLKGHGIGCEYNGRFLIRFSTQRVGDVMQGAVYPFSMTDEELIRRTGGVSPLVDAKSTADVTRGLTPPVRQQGNFEGPLCCGVSPKGEIYIGSIADSGWAGGQNTGSIVKLKGNGQRPNGIREIRATRDGFDIEFFAPVDRARATNGENYSISGYTRVWGGAYATPDSDRHRCKVPAVELSADGKTANLKVDPRKTPNYVYDISCREVAVPDKPLWPDYGFFTLHKIP